MASIYVLPESMPPALRDGHSFQPLPNARKRDRDAGESRMRPRFRSVPDVCTVSWFIEDQAVFDAFHDWFEETIVVGTEDFDIQVADREAFGRRWYTARFIDDAGYEVQIDECGRYTVSATLWLVEDIGTERVAPGIEASGGIVFGGGASFELAALAGSGDIAFSGGAVFVPPALLAAGGIEFEGGAEFPASVEARITEDDEDRLTEDDETRVLE
ncbi:hypothetical protein [Caldimonas sp. KR1-144]|uniref:hypothetical protein n=1 Tax=Caldimonas sp. KR1-144 TaxID=3400911 RepID=UPI003C0EC4A9